MSRGPGTGDPTAPATPVPLVVDERDAQVLIVDDEPYNRELLREVVTEAGCRVAEAAGGKEALAMIARELPDVVLLDVMMPEMDGIAVCRRLKSDPSTAHLPVILVTALAERGDRLEGIAAGADDFLNKPVDRHEVQLRVRNAVQRKRLFDRLREKYRELSELEAMRDELTQMLVHDLRSPLSAIAANLELLENSLGEQLSEDAGDDLAHARTGVTILVDLVTAILDVSQAETSRIPMDVRPVELGDLLERALTPLRPLSRGHDVALELPDTPVTFMCDPDLLRRTVTNLIGNALKFTPSGGRIGIRGWKVADVIRIEVQDSGRGIDPALQDHIFERFSGVRGSGGSPVVPHSNGLGLRFCRLAVEAHGGRVGVRSEAGEGSLFWIELPTARPREP